MNLHNLYKLKTHEDPTHIHKILGGGVLIHYMYRYYLLLTMGTMDLQNRFSLFMIFIHAFLSCSSMAFHIPITRNKNAPMIYPEYRLHSIVFTLRSVVCFILTYYDYHIFYKFFTCIMTMVFADIVTFLYKDGTTMGSMPFDNRLTEYERNQITNMHSCQQLSATLFMFGNLDSCFSPMCAIQIASFLMTLVRKSIISANMWHIVYAIFLWINIFCYYSLPVRYIIIQILLFSIFYEWRFQPRDKNKQSSFILVGNKYIGWSGMFLLFYMYNYYHIFENNSIIQKYEMEMKYGIILSYLVVQIHKCRYLFYYK